MDANEARNLTYQKQQESARTYFKEIDIIILRAANEGKRVAEFKTNKKVNSSMIDKIVDVLECRQFNVTISNPDDLNITLMIRW